VQLQVGDIDGYRKTCAAMVTELKRTGNANLAMWVADACVVTSEPEVDLAPVVDWLERGAAQDPNRCWYWHRLGAAHYRTGRFEEAVRALDRARHCPSHAKDGGAVTDWLFLAMAHHRLDHAKEARQWLDKAIKRVERNARNPSAGADPWFVAWQNRLKASLLRREAEVLVKKAKP
jgi:tetratricopeptide (TPR) repeat protein